MSLSSITKLEPQTLHYRVELFNPNAHQYRVTLTVPKPLANQRVSLPAWIPGSYLIRDFARNIVRINAHTGGRPVELQQLDKHSWQASNAAGEALELECLIYAFDTSVRSAFLDGLRGFFNGTSLFLEVEGAEQLPCELQLLKPDGDLADWQVATGLTAVDIDSQGFGLYQAVNYEQLIDCPFEMGGEKSEFRRIEFAAAGVPHSIVLNGRHTVDEKRLAADLTTICEQQISLFGDTPPFDDYVFLTQVTTNSYGGLEHMNSTALVCARDDLPQLGDSSMSDGYRQFLGLCSHEYFHCWNVKRIRPKVFAESGLQEEAYSGLLWAFEGITSYYDDLALVRCGLITAESYLELLGQTITRVYRGEGRKEQSVFESSFNAWSKFYKQDANAANAIVSYYTKGSLVALALDLTLRQHETSLDQVMQSLWQQYGDGSGVPEHGIQPVAEELAGISLQTFFDNYVYGREDPPLAELLADVGVDLHWREANGLADKGGKPDAKAVGHRSFGATVAANGKVQTVSNGSAAEQAGLAPGDELVALNGYRAGQSVDKLVQRQEIGSTALLTVFRDDQLLALSLPITAAAKDTAYLSLNDAEKADESWFKG